MRKLLYYFELILLGVLLPFASQSAVAQNVGMVVDNETGKAIVFNPVTNTVLGSVTLPGGGTIGDCAITGDGRLGFVTNFVGTIWVIDLTTTPPSLAAGTNPIPISNPGEDVVITPNQRFLVVCDGSGSAEPISVIDIAARAEIATFSLPSSDFNSLDLSIDGSILATSDNNNVVYRLSIDDNGNITNTGETLSIGDPNNVYISPVGGSGVVVMRGSAQIQSFVYPGLTPVSLRTLSGTFGISGQFSAAGNRFFVRSNNAIDVFTYDPGTAVLGATPLLTIPIAGTSTYYGMDQMALSPDGTRLYVSQPDTIKVYNSTTGALVASITHADIEFPTGICFPTGITAIAGMKWNDVNADGIMGPGEPGLEGWTINLAGQVNTSTTTNASGNYFFGPLPPGTYTVSEQMVLGWGQTAPPLGTFTIILAPNQFSSGNNFGNKSIGVGRGTAKGMVFDDRNGNGVKDPDEPGLSAWRVQLSGPGGIATLTDANGNYTFSNIPAGNYAVTVFLPSGWAQTFPPGGAPRNITVANGGTVSGVDFGTRMVTGVEESWGNPTEYKLYQNFPNPFNPTTSVSFYLPNGGYVTLKVFNVLGIEVASLFEGRMSSGTHSVAWDAQDVPSGIYVYRLTAGSFSSVKKMVLMK